MIYIYIEIINTQKKKIVTDHVNKCVTDEIITKTNIKKIIK